MKNLKKSVLCMLMAVIMVMTVTAASVIPVHDVYAASVKLNKTSLNLYTISLALNMLMTRISLGSQASFQQKSIASL